MEDGRVEIVVGLYDFLISSKKFIQGTVLNTRAFAFLFVSRRASTASLKGSQSWYVYCVDVVVALVFKATEVRQ